ncbi:preprotein translocase subunit SecD [Lysobacter enzymogenes]|uniref:SecDF P1 head subdomain-containing protein n=1 Tax=Lysobacter enzymogenes TaxID=69 RepID=UPI003393212F
MKARALAAMLALAMLAGASACAPQPSDSLRNAKPVRGDVAFYLAADGDTAGARTFPVLRPYPGQPAQVAVKPVPVIARGQVALVALSVDESGQSALDLQLTEPGAQRLAQVTRDNVGKRLAVVVGAMAVNVATIQGEIPGGRLRVSGLNMADAEAFERELVVAK